MVLKKIQIPAFIFLLILFFSTISYDLKAQISVGSNVGEIDYLNPQKYELGGVTISGVQYLDNNVLIMLSGLTVGNSITIPGDEIKKAIEKLWEQGLFENIKITATKIQGDVIFLNIDLRERPRLSKFSFKGVKKGEVDKLRDEIKLTRGDVVTENVIMVFIWVPMLIIAILRHFYL